MDDDVLQGQRFFAGVTDDVLDGSGHELVAPALDPVDGLVVDRRAALGPRGRVPGTDGRAGPFRGLWIWSWGKGKGIQR